MAPQLHLNILKRSKTPTNPPSPQGTLSTPSSPTASPKSSSLPASPNPSSLPASPNPSVASTAIPNRDPLPLSADALEGLLNARASQLQKLADRIESVNEWLEMDSIVLAKIVTDISIQVDREEEANRASEEAAERAAALWKENNPYDTTPAASRGPVSPGSYRSGVNKTGSPGSPSSSSGGGVPQHRRLLSGGESRVPEVYLKNPFLTYGRKTKDERIDDNCSVRDLRERIKAMRKWRREIERTVCWQREEYRRVLKALHRESVDESSRRSSGARRVVQFKEDEEEEDEEEEDDEEENDDEENDDDEEEEEGDNGGEGAVEGKGKGKEKEKKKEGAEEGKGKGKGKEKKKEGAEEGKGKGKEKEKEKEKEQEEGAKPVKKTGVKRAEGWGVGGQTWQKIGRVPSQWEWEELFSDGRIPGMGWEDKGAGAGGSGSGSVRRRYLGSSS